MEKFDLSGRVAIVTGGQGILGSGYVEALAKAGAKVAVFDIKKEDSPTIARLKKEALIDVITIQVDITDGLSVQEAFKEVHWRFGGSDNGALNGVPSILVNNAGIDASPHSSGNNNPRFEDYSVGSWDAVLNSHLKGSLLVTQKFVERFRITTQEKGSIINISSIYGVVSPDQSLYDFLRKDYGQEFYKPIAYTVAKAGMIGFTKWLAGYFKYERLPIRINTLVLGGVYNRNHDPKFVRAYQKHAPLAAPGDYDEAVLFLASDASRNMTGSEMTIDGGYTAF